ncbi:metal-dependent hydrolase [Arenibaculum pallidiluteum]|uniref:metal-dependent hydrolase n=1 Tax=Arenibaculum pallidiluteum TaxID=2812559 RepID=UPI001A976845|nr:metal-dependent hydrolase [Arenibaculum pallidiluteum]
MDTLTQMLLGAAVGQAGFRRRLGRRAIAAGAVIGLLPDLDVAAGWIGGTFATWLHHRGVTHSVFFGPLAGPVIGWLAWLMAGRRGRAGPPGQQPGEQPDCLRSWVYLAIMALITHPAIDLFTSYGTQLLAPLSRFRFAINAMPIIDPVYSLFLVAAVLVGILARNRPRLAQDAAAAALVAVTGYTLMAWSINDRIEAAARDTLPDATRVTAYPTLFQPYYRRIVAETPEAVLVGYRSFLSDRPVRWQRFARDADPRIAAVAATPEARLFAWFAMGNLHWQVVPGADGGAVVEARDTRYGSAGADLGFWGIRAPLDAAGAPSGPVHPFSARPPVSGAVVVDLWAEIVGD